MGGRVGRSRDHDDESDVVVTGDVEEKATGQDDSEVSIHTDIEVCVHVDTNEGFLGDI